jgi:hypothetical protein
MAKYLLDWGHANACTRVSDGQCVASTQVRFAEFDKDVLWTEGANAPQQAPGMIDKTSKVTTLDQLYAQAYVLDPILKKKVQVPVPRTLAAHIRCNCSFWATWRSDVRFRYTHVR